MRSSLVCSLTVNGQPEFTNTINVTHASRIMGRKLLISATYGLLADDHQGDIKRKPLQRYRVLYHWHQKFEKKVSAFVVFVTA
jgi:hypothetical protein